MKRLVKALLSILCFSLIVGGALAQTADRPIYSYRNGDIWKYDLTNATATQLTNWGYNGGPILSPDGSKIAYLSVSSDFVTQFEAEQRLKPAGPRRPISGSWTSLPSPSRSLPINQAPAQRGSCDRCPIGRQIAASSYGSKWTQALKRWTRRN